MINAFVHALRIRSNDVLHVCPVLCVFCFFTVAFTQRSKEMKKKVRSVFTEIFFFNIFRRLTTSFSLFGSVPLRCICGVFETLAKIERKSNTIKFSISIRIWSDRTLLDFCIWFSFYRFIVDTCSCSQHHSLILALPLLYSIQLTLNGAMRHIEQFNSAVGILCEKI